MQKPDLSTHSLLHGVISDSKMSEVMPYPLSLYHRDAMTVWLMLDPAQYRWRGLVHKITAERLTYGIDWELKGGRFTLKAGDRGQEHTLVIIVK